MSCETRFPTGMHRVPHTLLSLKVTGTNRPNGYVSRPILYFLGSTRLKSWAYFQLAWASVNRHIFTSATVGGITALENLQWSSILHYSLPVSYYFDTACVWTSRHLIRYCITASRCTTPSVFICFADLCGVKCVSMRVRLQSFAGYRNVPPALAAGRLHVASNRGHRYPPKPKPELEMVVKPTTGSCCI